MSEPTTVTDRSSEGAARKVVGSVEHPLLIGLVLAIHAAMLVQGAIVHSPTWDEIGHLPRESAIGKPVALTCTA